MPLSPLNALAHHFSTLHTPSAPLVLTNVWDAATAHLAAAHPSTRALATASYAIAASTGAPTDASLTWPQNLARIRCIAPVAAHYSLPLTVDLQDGYSDAELPGIVTELIGLGVVGCNIEDVDNATNALRGVGEAVGRIKLVKRIATEQGVPDFVVNARTDVLYLLDGATVEDAVERGRAYLEAGARTVFVWGGPGGRGVGREEVGRLVQGLGGMVNVKQNLRPGYLTTGELRALGVARVSIGPELFVKAMDAYKKGMEEMLAG